MYGMYATMCTTLKWSYFETTVKKCSDCVYYVWSAYLLVQMQILKLVVILVIRFLRTTKCRHGYVT